MNAQNPQEIAEIQDLARALPGFQGKTEIPANPLVQSTPADTLRRCAAVLGMLEGLRPDECPADPEGLGLAAVLQCVGGALEFEATRVAV